MSSTNDTVDRLWALSGMLRDAGISYAQYVDELTLLLFFKMCKETRKEGRLPVGCRWDDLRAGDPEADQLEHYKKILVALAHARDPLVRAVFVGAETSIRDAEVVEQLVRAIDDLDWYVEGDDLGDLYEALLEKNAGETGSGAGHYYTPRPIVDAMVEVMKPQPGEFIQDPAAGTGGFLVAADAYIKRHSGELFDLSERQVAFQRRDAFVGLELVPGVRRLALMNCLLHDIEGSADGAVRLGDALSSDGTRLPKADLILTNPPFGRRKEGPASRDDLAFPTSDKPLMFLQHIYRALVPGGRAAVVVPDAVLFEEGTSRAVRTDLMEKCDLHTIVRLPTGVFYAEGVKANILFFTRGRTDTGNTDTVWFYDLRTGAPPAEARTKFVNEHLRKFAEKYGGDPRAGARPESGVQLGRFHPFTRQEIAARGDNLDLVWLPDGAAALLNLADEPPTLAASPTLSSEVIHQRGPYRQPPAVTDIGFHPSTAKLLIDAPLLAHSAAVELNQFIELLWRHDLPAPVVAALGRLKLQVLVGVFPWTLWHFIEELDAVFRPEQVPPEAAGVVQEFLREARRKARGTYLVGLLSLPVVAAMAVTLMLAGVPLGIVAATISYAALTVAAGAHVMQLSNQHVNDLSRMINDLKHRIPELQPPTKRQLPGAAP